MPFLDAHASWPVTCSVVETQSSVGARWALRIQAFQDVSGQYSLRVEKVDPAGTATMQQGGRFEATAGETRDVGQLAVSVQVPSRLQVEGYLVAEDLRIPCASIKRDAL